MSPLYTKLQELGGLWTIISSSKLKNLLMRSCCILKVRSCNLQKCRDELANTRRNKGGQIATSTLRNYLREICTLAGTSLKGLHAFRRGVTDSMQVNRARMNIIATWLGRTNINTTVQYFRLKENKERLKEGLDYI